MTTVYDRVQRILSGDATRRLSEHIGATEEQTAAALRVAVPTLTTALANNARRRRGAEEILEALRRDHDGSVLEDEAVVQGSREKDGEGILRHVLGDNRGQVEQGVGQFVDLDAKSIGKLLIVLGPIIMGVLGRMRERREVNNGGDLRKILRREERTAQRRDRGVSDILREVLRGGGTGQSQGAGCLSMLGPLLGRR